MLDRLFFSRSAKEKTEQDKAGGGDGGVEEDAGPVVGDGQAC